MPPDGPLGLALSATAILSCFCSRGMNAGSGKTGKIWSFTTSSLSLSFSTGWFHPQSMGGVARRTCRGLRRLSAAGVEDSAILDDHTMDGSIQNLTASIVFFFIVLNGEGFHTDLALILGCDTLSSVFLTFPSRVSSTRMSSQERLRITL